MDKNKIQKYIEKRIRETGIGTPTLDDINMFLAEFMQIRNSRPLGYFESYSPLDMQNILHNLLGTDCPIQLADFTEEDCESIPLFRQVKVLLELLEKEEIMKLTQTGNLPVRVLKEVYSVGASESHIESGLVKLRSENDTTSVQMARIAAELIRAVKKQNNKLSLTKNGKKLFASNRNLLNELLPAMLNRFNIAYFDNYYSENIGAVGIGFTLFLLSKYGGTDRLDTFYSDKYFKAFPMLLEEVTEAYMSQDKVASNCYSHRIFDILLYHLGLVTIEETEKWPSHKKLIHKTKSFDRLFKIIPPKTTN